MFEDWWRELTSPLRGSDLAGGASSGRVRLCPPVRTNEGTPVATRAYLEGRTVRYSTRPLEALRDAARLRSPACPNKPRANSHRRLPCRRCFRSTGAAAQLLRAPRTRPMLRLRRGLKCLSTAHRAFGLASPLSSCGRARFLLFPDLCRPASLRIRRTRFSCPTHDTAVRARSVPRVSRLRKGAGRG